MRVVAASCTDFTIDEKSLSAVLSVFTRVFMLFYNSTPPQRGARNIALILSFVVGSYFADYL